MITDKQAAYIARWNETRDTALGFIRELLADRADRVRIEAELRAAVAERDATIAIIPHNGPCPILECPPGIFLFGNSIGFKTEYGDDDVYVVESGEAFWGGTNTEDKRNRLVVQPCICTNHRPTINEAAGDSARRLLDAARLCAEVLEEIHDDGDLSQHHFSLSTALQAARAAGLLRNEDGDEARQGFGPRQP